MVKIFHHALLDSTQYEAGRILKNYDDDAEAGVLFAVTARAQTHGHGRFNRTWAAPTGTAALLTIAVRMPKEYAEHASWLTGICALGVREVISAHFPQLASDLTLAWPNDLMIDNHKIAGVIATIASQPTPHHPWLDIICGIGLNTTMSTAQLPVSQATSLRVVLEKRGADLGMSTEDIQLRVITHICERIEHWEECQYDVVVSGIAEEYRRHLATIGQRVSATILTHTDPKTITGVFTGFTAHGHGLIETTSGFQTLTAADVTLR